MIPNVKIRDYKIGYNTQTNAPCTKIFEKLNYEDWLNFFVKMKIQELPDFFLSTV